MLFSTWGQLEKRKSIFGKPFYLLNFFHCEAGRPEEEEAHFFLDACSM
jgi:hypothetical protein